MLLFSPHFPFEMQVAGWKVLSNRHAPPVSTMKIPCFLWLSTMIHLDDSLYILMVQKGAPTVAGSS